MSVFALGLNHQTAPIDLRGRFAFPLEQLSPALKALVQQVGRPVSGGGVIGAPEVALLGLLEVIFGVLWAWVGAGEEPGSSALMGGGIVVGALVFNELLSLRGRQALQETT